MEQKPTKPLEIEICARRGGNWYTHAGPPVPLLHAQIKEPPYCWGAGRTPEEALYSSDPEELLKLVRVEEDEE